METKYTFYRIDFNNFTHNDGDYDIVANLGEVAEVLETIDPILDSESFDPNEPYSVTITGIPMTIAEYTKYQVTKNILDD